MNQKGVRNIVLVTLILVLAAIVGYFVLRKPVTTTPAGPLPTTHPTSKNACQNLYDEIENDLTQANYCQNDSDCDVLNLGSSYIAFGCFHFVNKAVDKNRFYEKMRVYDQSCTDIIDECAPAPKPSCVASRCVYIDMAGKLRDG